MNLNLNCNLKTNSKLVLYSKKKNASKIYDNPCPLFLIYKFYKSLYTNMYYYIV